MTNKITVVQQMCKTVDLMQGSLTESLEGTGIDAKRFVATAKTAIQSHPQQDRLEKSDKKSLFLAITKAATDGLMPDGRESALVVYGNQVQYQPMVQGLVKLARNSGEIESLGASVVFENDKFSYREGLDDLPTHEADWFGDRGTPVGVWAYVKLKSGEYLQPVMLTKERIDRIATRSKQAGNYNFKTGKDWEEFWKKAAIRNILKYAPKSTATELRLQSAIDASDEEFEIEGDVVDKNDAPVVTDKPKRKTRASAAVKAQAEKVEPVLEPEAMHTESGGVVVEGVVSEVDEGEDIPV